LQAVCKAIPARCVHPHDPFDRNHEGYAMTTTAARVDTWEMVLVHRVFRREFRLLPTLIRSAPAGDTARAEVLGDHLQTLTDALEHHHTGEDELLWPVLLERITLHAELVHRMEAQHGRLHVLLDRISELTPRWRATGAAPVRDELADVVAQASVALDEHLTDEEQEILPLVSEHVRPAEWDALNKRGQDSIPKNAKAFVFLGSILEEASPREQRMFLAQIPAPARLAWKLLGPRVYGRSRDRIRLAR
jgi:hemerythrin-like domain-containing protein